MQFCPKCYNILDISKVPSTKISALTPTELSDTLTDFDHNDIVDKLFNGEKIDDKDAKKIDVIALQSSKSFLELNAKNQAIVLKNLEKLLGQPASSSSSSGTDAFMICKKCYYHKKLTDLTLIFSKSSDNEVVVYENTFSFPYLKHNHLHPRTRNYKCKNVECPTHKDSNIREAILYKGDNQFELTYICTVCDTWWKN